MINSTHNELIEQYLVGNLKGAQLQQFETLLESDPAIKSEVDFQQNIVDSISEYRKQELKAKLSNIVISGGMSTIQKTMLVAASVVTTLFVGYSIYNSSDKEVVSKKTALPLEESTSSNPSPVISTIEETNISTESQEFIEDENEIIETEITPIIDDHNTKSITIRPSSNPFDNADIGEDTFTDDSEGNTNVSKFSSDITFSKRSNINTIAKEGGHRLKYIYNGETLELIGKRFKDHKETFTLLMDSNNSHLYLVFEGEYYEIINHKNRERYTLHPMKSEKDINKIKEAE